MPEQAPDGSIIITPKEFYDGVRDDISEIKEAVSGLRSGLSPLPARVEKTEARLDAVEKEISSVKIRIAWYSGAGTAVGAVAATLIQIFLK